MLELKIFRYFNIYIYFFVHELITLNCGKKRDGKFAGNYLTAATKPVFAACSSGQWGFQRVNVPVVQSTVSTGRKWDLRHLQPTATCPFWN